MMFQIDETIRAYYFRQVDSGCNFAAALNQDDAGIFKLTYRLRYRRDVSRPDTWQNAEKNWYVMTPPAGTTLQSALARVDEMQRVVGPLADGPLHSVIRGDKSLDDFKRELLAQPWISVEGLE